MAGTPAASHITSPQSRARENKDIFACLVSGNFFLLYCLGPSPHVILPLHHTQPCLGNRATYNGLHTIPTSIYNQDNDPYMYPQVKLLDNSSFRLTSQVILNCVKLNFKTTQHTFPTDLIKYNISIEKETNDFWLS